MSDEPEFQAKLARLREDFPPEQIGKLPKGGAKLDYVGHAAVTARLLEVDPFWTWEPMALEDGLPKIDRDPQGRPIGLWIRLTVLGITRPGYGSVVPGASEPIKQLISDALRNASMRFGVALALWSKEELAASPSLSAPVAVPPEPDSLPAWIEQLIKAGRSEGEILDAARELARERQGDRANPIPTLQVLSQAPQDFSSELLGRLYSEGYEG